MAMLGPIALLVLLATWLVLIMTGYTLMYLADHRPLADPGRGTVGILDLHPRDDVGPTPRPPSCSPTPRPRSGCSSWPCSSLTCPASTGPSRGGRAGWRCCRSGPGIRRRRPTMLIRYHRIEEPQYRLTELWRQWEAWFADIEETHTTFPILAFFRSPQPERSWITSAGALLDGASFWAAAIEHPRDPDVQLCIRAGYLALRRIADIFKVRYDVDPSPGRSDHACRARNGTRPWRRWRRPAYRSSPTGIRPGRTGRAGGSTTTRCCSTWPAWSRRRRRHGSRIAVP